MKRTGLILSLLLLMLALAWLPALAFAQDGSGAQPTPETTAEATLPGPLPTSSKTARR